MDMEKRNGENAEEMEQVTAPAEEALQEEPVPEETPVEAEEEVPAEKETAQKAFDLQGTLSIVKENLMQFLNKVRVTVPEEEYEEPEQEENEPEQEEPVQEEAPEQPAEEVKVRRKPADAFEIDFPVEEAVAEVVQPEAGEEDAEEGDAAEEATTEEIAAAEAADQENLIAEEEPEKKVPAWKKLKPLHLGLVIAGCVILLAALAFFVLRGAGIDLGPRENSVRYKDSYVVAEEKLTKKADTVVATIGDRELTLSELQLYYMNGIYTFYSQNYYYLSYIGLDLTMPLDEQPYLGEENMTWEQYFLDAALKSWQSYTIVEILAEQEGFVVSEEVQAQIDSMASQLDSIAAAYGYASAADYLNEEMAPGVSPETYVNFNRVYYICNEYINNFYQENYPNSKDITLYYKENQETFDANGITRDIGLMSDVRHILIQPQGGVTDESGNTTYSEEEWATALSEAERILEQWRVGEATEDSFAVLANTYSADGGSNTTGGLYEDINIDSSYVPEFKAWATDFTRQPGDVEIVQTTYGYHIMYFVEGQNYFEYVVGEQLLAERVQNKLLEVKDEFPMEVNYKKIFLCESAIG